MKQRFAFCYRHPDEVRWNYDEAQECPQCGAAPDIVQYLDRPALPIWSGAHVFRNRYSVRGKTIDVISVYIFRLSKGAEAVKLLADVFVIGAEQLRSADEAEIIAAVRNNNPLPPLFVPQELKP